MFQNRGNIGALKRQGPNMRLLGEAAAEKVPLQAHPVRAI